MKICRGLARMEWTDIDKQLKALRGSAMDKKQLEKNQQLKELFINNARKYSKMKLSKIKELYDQMCLYLFNKSHGAAYGLISYYEMWLKHYYPMEFYYALLKFEEVEFKREAYKSEAVREGCIVLMPHVNGGRRFALVELEGEKVIQEGISSIKNIGEKTASEIERLGPYSCYDDFMEAVPKRIRNIKVLEALEKAGALEFNKKKLLNNVVRYNSYLYSKNFRIH